MKIQQKRAVLVVLALVTAFTVVGWVLDMVKLSRCRFISNSKYFTHKAEILYGIGAVVPPVGAFMGWFVNARDDDETPEGY